MVPRTMSGKAQSQFSNWLGTFIPKKPLMPVGIINMMVMTVSFFIMLFRLLLMMLE